MEICLPGFCPTPCPFSPPHVHFFPPQFLPKHPSLPAPLSAPGFPCLASCTLGSLGVSASHRLQSHPRKDPTSVSIPTFLQSSGMALPAAPGPLRREDPQVLRSSNRGPGLPGFMPHPPTPLFCPGEAPHPRSGIRKPSPTLSLLSLSWLQLSLPGVLTTSEVPGRASAFSLAKSPPR